MSVLDKVKRQARRLDLPALHELHAYLHRLIADAEASQTAEPESDDEPDPPCVTIQRKWVKCGKPGCRCAKGEPHGPYLYQTWREGEKVRSKYLGKEEPK